MNEQETKKVEVDLDFFIKVLSEYQFQYKEMKNRLEMVERAILTMKTPRDEQKREQKTAGSVCVLQDSAKLVFMV